MERFAVTNGVGSQEVVGARPLLLPAARRFIVYQEVTLILSGSCDPRVTSIRDRRPQETWAPLKYVSIGEVTPRVCGVNSVLSLIDDRWPQAAAELPHKEAEF